MTNTIGTTVPADQLQVDDLADLDPNALSFRQVVSVDIQAQTVVVVAETIGGELITHTLDRAEPVRIERTLG